MSIHTDRYFALLKRRRPEKSYQIYYIEAHLESKKELLMSPRQMRIYWEEPNMDVSPAGCFSRYLTYRQSLWSSILKKKRVTHV